MNLVDEAVQIAYNAIFPNMGQCCCAGSRTFVHADIYDAFVQKATELAAKRKVGNPFEEGVDQGPQFSFILHPAAALETSFFFCLENDCR